MGAKFDIELFSPAIQNAKELVDQRLDHYTRFGIGCPENLQEAIRYSLLSPGKRLRPLLVLAAAEVCGGAVLDGIPAACAVEMIHAYSLIHDDLPAMDNDDLRRGRPTCHIKFGEATAILAGDALIPLAFEVLARDSKSPVIAAESCRVLAVAAGACQLVGGQADDLQGGDDPGDDNKLEMLRQIHYRKTAALLAVSLRLGAISANADLQTQELLEKFGRKLGLAFQITDDLLDFLGEQDKIGKRVGKDLENGKRTYPVLLGVAESQRCAVKLIDEASQMLQPLGAAAQPLHDLAAFVINRTA